MTASDLVVIGAGPGGYVAAIRAAQLGMTVTVVEQEALGGVCLNWGCIPSKALLRNAEVLSLIRNAERFGIGVGEVRPDYAKAVERSRRIVNRLTRGVASLFRKHGIEHVQGRARLLDPHAIETDHSRIETARVVIATGSRPRALPGFDVDGNLVVTYRQAIVQSDVPREVIIIGGGAIGVEFAYVYNAYGAQVTLLEHEPAILPREDAEVTDFLTRAITKQGIAIHANCRVTGMERTDSTATVTAETQGGSITLRGDRILVAVGITPNTEGLGLEETGVRLRQDGYIDVNADLQTSVDGIYAIGDVTGIMPLAHVAQAQGVYLAERLAGQEVAPLDYGAMPRAVYCNPQVASFGLTEREAQERGLDYRVGRFPMSANGKALALDEPDGLAKVITDAHSGELLGSHLIGHEVTEAVAELSLARYLEGTHLEVGAVVNPHPSISEAVKEAALNVENTAVHI